MDEKKFNMLHNWKSLSKRNSLKHLRISKLSIWTNKHQIIILSFWQQAWHDGVLPLSKYLIKGLCFVSRYKIERVQLNGVSLQTGKNFITLLWVSGNFYPCSTLYREGYANLPPSCVKKRPFIWIKLQVDCMLLKSASKVNIAKTVQFQCLEFWPWLLGMMNLWFLVGF